MEDRWQARLDAGDDLVFTVGVIKTAPTAAISVIPGEVSFTVDMRSLSMDTVKAFHEDLLATARSLAAERGVRFEFDTPLYTQPAHVDASLGNCGIPVAMIFVANQKGSHNPHEAMELEDFIKGAELLRHAVEDFDL